MCFQLKYHIKSYCAELFPQLKKSHSITVWGDDDHFIF